MEKNLPIKKWLLVFIAFFVVMFSLSGCTIDNRHVEMSYNSNDNSNVHGWDDIDSSNDVTWNNVDTTTWDDDDEIVDWVASETLFDNVADGYISVESDELTFDSTGNYFDGETVYKLVGKQFELNKMITEVAVGTGVIVICVVMNFFTAGAATPVACFFAGAASSAISSAVKGAAFGAAMGAVTSAIKSNGAFDDTLYGTLSGASEGYMWGAIYGAITGGFNSKCCFDGSTEVLTSLGHKNISDVHVGDLVYSYEEKNNVFSYKKVTQVLTGKAASSNTIEVGDSLVKSTLNHPFLTDKGWVKASSVNSKTKLFKGDGGFCPVDSSFQKENDAFRTFNLCVEDNHTYCVGSDDFVVHNNCPINSNYSGKTYHFPEGSQMAKKYPNGVPFSDVGYPDFSQYAVKKEVFEFPSNAGRAAGTCLTGNDAHDFLMANELAGFGSLTTSPAGYTWHHVEDMKTLLLIPYDIHHWVRHTGGASLIKALFGLSN